jgi:hypothetical protein
LKSIQAAVVCIGGYAVEDELVRELDVEVDTVLELEIDVVEDFEVKIDNDFD